MRILLLSRYDNLGASSRLRLFQYLPFLESKDWEIDVSPLFSDSYVQALYSETYRATHVLTGFLHRIKILLQVKKYDLVWIEKELFPFMPALVERLLVKVGVSYVVDYDDAWFHRYNKHPNRLIRVLLGCKIDTVMRNASLVIAGNQYIAERARIAGAQRVEIIPTVVDLTRYSVKPRSNNQQLVVGWIGSPSTSHYLVDIAPVFELLKKDFNVKFVAVGASKDALKGLPIEVIAWSEDTEVDSIQDFDIGIMPLVDSPWERGKCGYKLIQYMACGLPVVASPVGVNAVIVEHGVNGFHAHDILAWEQNLRTLLEDSDIRRQMGKNGRILVESWYSLQVQAPLLDELFHDVMGQ